MDKKEKLQAQRNELFAHSTDTLARIKELDKEIKELKEPKLRHLDYYHDGCNMVLIAKKDDMWLMHYPKWASTAERGEQGMIDRIGSCGYIRQGNLADDLTETSDGFEMENIGKKAPFKVAVYDEHVNLHDLGEDQDGPRIRHKDLPEFISSLQRVLNYVRSKT